MPALLGLKGNLEMTLASRLSTAVSVLAGRPGVCRGLRAAQSQARRARLAFLNCPRLEHGAGVGRCREIPGWVSCSWQGLPAPSGSQAQFLDVPAVPGLLPHPLFCNLPCDYLCSFDRQASCWSLHLHRWGPPLISGPTLQLGRSRARPSQPPSHPIPFPYGFKGIDEECSSFLPPTTT